MGIVLRYAYYKNKMKSCGTNVAIFPKVAILYPSNISIGNNVSIHTLCYIDGEGGLEIGDNVSLAHNTSIITFNHTWDDDNIPIKYNPKIYKTVVIEDDVWVGCGVRIMPGVRIGKRTVIGAGSVVTKSCTTPGIYGGVPAKLIKAF